MAIILSDGNMVPDLPNYDTSQYPYVVINSSIGQYTLYLSKQPITVKTLTDVYNIQALIVSAGYMEWRCYVAGGDWEYIETGADEGQFIPISIQWSNHDIINEDDGTVFFAASDPDYVIMPKADYKAACDAIRAKTGKTYPIKSGDMASEIESIPTI